MWEKIVTRGSTPVPKGDHAASTARCVFHGRLDKWQTPDGFSGLRTPGQRVIPHLSNTCALPAVSKRLHASEKERASAGRWRKCSADRLGRLDHRHRD